MSGITAMKAILAISWVLGLTIVAVIATNSTQLVCLRNGSNQTDPPDPRYYIVGGQPGTNPSAVSIQYIGQHHCVGTILNAQHVYVPASCLHNKKLKYFSVIYGRTKLEQEGGETRGIADSRSNPDWVASDWYWSNDEAVIKVDSPVTFSDSIKPVCLADERSVFPTGTDASVYGWGFISQEEELPSPQELQYVNVTVTDHEECRRIYQGMVTDGMICAGNLGGGQDTCTRDQGAPLMVTPQGGDEWIQAGAVIRGPKVCGEAGKPTIYWRPSEKFITSAIEEMRVPLPECGVRENLPDGLRIVQGQEAVPHSWPWTVYTQRCHTAKRADLQAQNVFGGVLLNRYFVATDCCVSSGDFVVLGAHSLSSSSEDIQKIKVEQRFRHPNFPYMSLLKLSRPVQFNKNVKPVCLPEPGVFPPAGTKCTITGWGQSSWDGPETTDLLQEGSATIITNDQCRRDYPWPEEITNTRFCTAASETHPTRHDWGAPLMCENGDSSWTLYGVLTWDGRPWRPSVYHNITSMLPWVNQITADQSSQVCFKTFHG